MEKHLRIKEGFEGERLISMPEEILEKCSKDPVLGNLYIRKAGFFPQVRYHYVMKDRGCDYTMLIYCIGGKGWYKCNGQEYTISKGQFIIIPQDTPYSFGADNDDPWTIYWVHYKGRLASSISTPYNGPKEIVSGTNMRIGMFEEIIKSFSMGYIDEYLNYASMTLYHLLASFIYSDVSKAMQSSATDNIAGRVIEFMTENLHHNLTLEEIATRFNYSASHLSSIFRKATGVSPIAYFLRLKIQKACQYIELTDLKINEISTLMGIEEPAYFTRLFTKIMGLTPKEYRYREKPSSNTR